MAKGANQIKRKTIEYIRKEVYNLSPMTQVISTDYVNNRTNMLFKCGCGKEFLKTWDCIQTKKSCVCVSCGHKQGWRKHRFIDSYENDLYADFKSHGFNPLGAAKLKKDKILCENKDGYRGFISWENSCLGKTFSVFSVKLNEQNLLYNLNLYAENNGLKTKVLKYSLQKGCSAYTIILCQCECGEIFSTNIGNFTTQNKCRCDKCTGTMSNMEWLVNKEILKYLDNSQVEKQKRFEDCRSPLNYPLPYDFYIPHLNLLIEVDGEQHFKPSKFKNETDVQAKENLEKRIKYDKIKDEYARSNSIQLIRIGYKNIKNSEYQNIIKQIFN